MLARSSVLVASVAILALVMAASAQGGTAVKGMSYLTFSQPVALPGVTLGPGTYIFEVPRSTMKLDIVTVVDVEESHAYFMGFTQRVERPAGFRHSVVLGESPGGGPPPNERRRER